MTGLELDRRMREILIAATNETSLSATAALVELGFPARASFAMVCAAIEHLPKGKR